MLSIFLACTIARFQQPRRFLALSQRLFWRAAACLARPARLESCEQLLRRHSFTR